MKSLILSSLMLLSVSAHANPADLFMCMTGDALAAVDVAVNGIDPKQDTLLLTVTFESDETKTFTATWKKGELQKGLKNGHLDVTFRSADSDDFGGAVSNAALFVVSKVKGGFFDGKLAFNNSVHTISCKPR